MGLQGFQLHITNQHSFQKMRKGLIGSATRSTRRELGVTGGCVHLSPLYILMFLFTKVARLRKCLLH